MYDENYAQQQRVNVEPLDFSKLPQENYVHATIIDGPYPRTTTVLLLFKEIYRETPRIVIFTIVIYLIALAIFH